jgi:predicted ATP-grasp superfamily ATP-dependent carboligase
VREVPQTMAKINLNLLACFNGYLPRAVNKLKEYRFRMVSYSPSTILIAEHSTEAFAVTSFPGQPIQKKGIKGIYF